MSEKFKQVIESIGDLASDERAFVAHCLISSLEIKHDDSVDEAWGEFAKKRLLELESGAVKGGSWGDIKNNIKKY